MFWIYTVIATFMAAVSGAVLLRVIVADPGTGASTLKALALFAMPVLGYWVGLVGTFLYCLGKSFE